MEIGVGLDATLGLSWAQQADVSKEAARLGYTSIWTPEGNGHDSTHVCAQRWAATREVVPEGLTTGIAVCPVTNRNPLGFAMSAGTVSDITGGRFILGLGSGGIQSGVLGTMRDYVTTVRRLLAGEKVTHSGPAVRLDGLQLGFRPPATPVYLAALGPEMLRLAGELADGAALNWCGADQVAWSRGQVAEGAVRAGRSPADVTISEYIRISVDDDIDTARRAFANAVMSYALGDRTPTARERQRGYRAHFERMGFTEALANLDRMRDGGATHADLIEAFPADLLLKVGYFGKAAGAREAFQALAEGLDTAIARVVAARPGVDATLAVMRACAPVA
jgi:alkanesulfonate monooxygenase SsuD/methylene tetrahydromethanopterin reductase-like flavin-dependent oxidoreductase (luciferase family)